MAILSCANAIRKSGMWAVVLFVVFSISSTKVPIGNLIALCVVMSVNQQAIKILKAAGYKVGFLGADLSQFTEEKQTQDIRC